MQRDTRTIKKAIDDISFTGKTGSKSKVSPRDLRKLLKVTKKMPMHSSNAAGVGEINRQSHCTMLKKVARVVKARARPLIMERNKQKRISLAKKYFSQVIFTDECRAAMVQMWICNDVSIPSRLRRQQGGGGLMFWAAIVGEELAGPFQMPEGVKRN